MSFMEECEIERLESELAVLRADLDRLTKGTWSKEIARLSAANAALRQERDEAVAEIRHVVNAHRFDREKFEDDADFENWLLNRLRAFLAKHKE